MYQFSALLMRRDFGLVLQRGANFIEAFQQACPSERIDIKMGLKAAAASDLAFFEINGQAVTSGSIAFF
jgi:hypothetical protein